MRTRFPFVERLTRFVFLCTQCHRVIRRGEWCFAPLVGRRTCADCLPLDKARAAIKLQAVERAAIQRARRRGRAS